MQFSRKSPRLDRRTLLAGLLSLGAGAPLAPAQADDFQAFVQALWPQAEAAGVSRETFERATADLTPDPGVVVKPKVQSEFTVSIPTYVGAAVTKARVEQGRALAKELAPVLRDVEKRYGVPGEVPLAILAIESNFGAGTGGSDVLRVLATLAWKGHLTEKLKEEFGAALLMLQDGFPRSKLRGSWAGAMGMPQFLPSTYRKFAVRYAGEGTPTSGAPPGRDRLHRELPCWLRLGFGPLLGLRNAGAGEPRLCEFRHGFREVSQPGIYASGGGRVAGERRGEPYLPTGAAGAGVFAHRQLGSRASIQYFRRLCAGGAGVLGDRIAGRDTPLRRTWPKVAPLATADIVKMQQALAQKGFYQGAQDGKLGRGMRNAIHAWQLSAGVSPADGFATRAVLERLLGG